MTVRSSWTVIEADGDNKIVFIEDDCHLTGLMSITNDAENVLKYFKTMYWRDWRVVYKDTNQEWWEIAEDVDGMWDSDFCIEFRPWHGLEWDILSRKENA